ncbi:DUF4886 domain-containing protein [Aliiglaciecola sp. NS0011-25]|uniref:DUF4886 domain-containing protein n=1 Tax=Aliiglaciecola sp. NS0011-25 TaxID=3127654 RepID=UPI0031023C69
MRNNAICFIVWTVSLLFTVQVNALDNLNSQALDPFEDVYTPEVRNLDLVTRILFIGNSFSFYNNGIHNHLGSLIRSAGKWETGQNRLRLSTLSGGHIYEQLTDLNYYLSDPKQNWQGIVLQGHSNEPIHSKKKALFERAMEKAITLIKQKDIKPILFMTWGYKGQPKMSTELANAYIKIANRYNVPVVPVGLAFAQAQSSLKNIELYVPDVLTVNNLGKADASLKYRRDWKHPSEAGTYLAACVFYASLYGKSPEGLIFHGTLSAEDATALQKLSWQVTREFFNQRLVN